MVSLNVHKARNSLGVLLPEEVISRLRTGERHVLFLTAASPDTRKRRSSPPCSTA